MTRVRDADLDRFYALLARLQDAPGQGHPLKDLPPKLPTRGVYFFAEPGELRKSRPPTTRVVRVGTHAVSAGAKSTLRSRLKQHLGTRSGGGNHRGSIFRLHVGAALLAREDKAIPTWGVGSSKPAKLRGSESLRAAEAAWEQTVSTYISSMPLLWIDVPDEPGSQSQRAYIERNAIALLSSRGSKQDPPSPGWLGRFSPRQEIRESGLWNLNHVSEIYEPAFLDRLEYWIASTQSNAFKQG